MTTAPYGSWPTPFTSASVVAGAVRLGELVLDGDDVLWAEGRPAEGGRTQLVRRRPDGSRTDLLADGWNARTAVHEYGGGGWWARDGVVWFANWADQRLYRLADGADPVPLTPEPASPRADRFADGDLAPDGATIVCVRERHHGPSAAEVVNEIVRLDAHAPGEPEVLVSGSDFVAAPRLSPDGGTLAWLRWNHPSMPWDATELVVRDLGSGDELVIAGGPDESVLEPRWSADGALWFVSDRSDWWNLYRYTPGTDIATVVRVDAEIGVPHWQFAAARYALLPDGSVVFARLRRGYDALCLRAPDGTVTELDTPFSRVTAVRAAPDGTVLVVAGAPTREPGVHRVDPAGGVIETLRPPRDLGVDPGFISVPEHITFPSDDGRTAHALFYPPAHPERTGPGGRAAAAHRGDPRRSDVRRVAGARHVRAVLDQPRVRRRRRQLRRLDGLRPRVPRGAAGAVGDRGRGRLPRRRPPPRPHRPRRRGAAHHPRRLGGRVHHARGAGPRRHAVRGGRRPLRRRRPRSARRATRTSSRAATWTGWSARTRRRATSTSSGPRSTTSTASPGR